MATLASKIDSSSSTIHVCWTLSLTSSPPNNEVEKIAGCRCSGLASVPEKKILKKINETFKKNGHLCLEGKDIKVVISNLGDIMLKDGEEFFPVVNIRGNLANINDKIPICLCYGCQKMKTTCTDIQNIGKLLSMGWFGLSSSTSRIESSSLTTHLCWSLSLTGPPPDNEAKKIVGCRCSGLKYIEKQELTKMINDHLEKKGQLCLEGLANKVYINSSGDITMEDENDFFPVVNVCKKPANINDKIFVCLCDGCQTMTKDCTRVNDIGGILSSGWWGLHFYINTTV